MAKKITKNYIPKNLQMVSSGVEDLKKDTYTSINHPSYKKRLGMEMFGKKDLSKEQLDLLDSEYNTRLSRLKSVNVEITNDPLGGFNDTEGNKVKISPTSSFHELSHSLERAMPDYSENKSISTKDIGFRQKVLDNKGYKNFTNLGTTQPTIDNMGGYISKPTEIKARINELRNFSREFGYSYDEPFDIRKYKKEIKKHDVFKNQYKDLRNMFKDKDINDLSNYVAINPNDQSQNIYQMKNGGKIPQYNLGGWMKENAGAIGSTLGIGLGALGSVLLPGVGTVAGMGLGASIGSALGGSVGGIVQSDYQANQNTAEQKRLQTEQMKAIQPIMANVSAKSMYGIYAKGGDIDGEVNPIINIEKGELAVQRPEPNSRVGKIVQEFTGKNPLTGSEYKPHAKRRSSEPVSNYVPTEMVKDELKADYIISKKYAKQYKDAAKRKDKFTINSILRNIDAESEMGKDPRNTQMKKGGAIPQYDLGGGLGSFQNPKFQIDPFTQQMLSSGVSNMQYVNPLQINSLPTSFNPQLKSSSIVPPTTGVYPNDGSLGHLPMTPMPTFKQPEFQLKGNITPNKTYPGGNSPIADPANPGMNPLTQNALLASVPGAINLARGLFEKPVKQQMVSPTFNPYEKQALSKLSGRVSSQPAISELNNQRNAYMQSLKGGTSNQSVYRSNLQNLFGNTGKTAGNIINQTRQTNLGLDVQEGQAMMNAGNQRVNAIDQARATNLQLNQMNQQSQAAKDNLLYSGLADMPKQQLQLNQNRQAQQMEAFKMMMMMDTFGTAKDMYNQPKYAKFKQLFGL